jgi:hypothetical protein
MATGLRRNLVDSKGEAWKPPAHIRPVTSRQQILSWLRRLFDLQFGSIWPPSIGTKR